mgnify:CR=1 FL=1
MEKKKLVVKSKNYFARIKIKKTEKDGEYYDVVFGLKKEKNRNMHAHFGIKVVDENDMIGGKIFFVEPRKATPYNREETFNAETGEFISRSEKQFGVPEEEIKAELKYATFFDKEKGKLILKEFKIVEKLS